MQCDRVNEFPINLAVIQTGHVSLASELRHTIVVASVPRGRVLCHMVVEVCAGGGHFYRDFSNFEMIDPR